MPPGTPASLTEPACPAGGTACIAVHSSVLTMLPGDDIDALCWWDVNGNGVPDVPSYALGPGITGDFYEFSFAPGSPSFPIFAGNVVYADGSGFFPPIVTDVALGLAFMTDDVDALVCHDTDGDADGVPTAGDNCFALFNPSQFDADLDGLGDACGPCDGETAAGHEVGLNIHQDQGFAHVASFLSYGTNHSG